jgi:hypothetical protein
MRKFGVKKPKAVVRSSSKIVPFYLVTLMLTILLPIIYCTMTTIAQRVSVAFLPSELNRMVAIG